VSRKILSNTAIITLCLRSVTYEPHIMLKDVNMISLLDPDLNTVNRSFELAGFYEISEAIFYCFLLFSTSRSSEIKRLSQFQDITYWRNALLLLSVLNYHV
jgi:hypothetical protein